MKSAASRFAGLALAAVCSLTTLTLLGGAPASAQTAVFPHPTVARDAERIAALLRTQTKPRQTAAELRRAGLIQLEDKDPRNAIKSLLAALVADGKHSPTWATLARAYLAIAPDPARGDVYELPALASGAAWHAHQLATDPRDRAAALVMLADTLKVRSLWRPAIDALQASLALADDVSVRDSLAKMRAEHGFRMIDYKIDADTAERPGAEPYMRFLFVGSHFCPSGFLQTSPRGLALAFG